MNYRSDSYQSNIEKSYSRLSNPLSSRGAIDKAVILDVIVRARVEPYHPGLYRRTRMAQIKMGFFIIDSHRIGKIGHTK